jgi:dTDP-4-dehydrorhamnose reductase
MTIAIFGAEGQLGGDLQQTLSSYNPTPIPHSDVDIVDASRVEQSVADARAEWVINAAAMTHVDRCESEDTRAFEVNAIGARNAARACAKIGARLIHISTDYVFDGTKRKPYLEDDPPRPLNAYGISKLAGELYVRNNVDQHYIVRTSGIYGRHPCRGKGGANFVDKMLELAEKKDELSVVADEVLTPTFAEDLSEQIRRLIEAAPAFGIYHATNDGECSWYEFAAEIFRIKSSGVTLKKTTSAEWKAPATRPAYSVLENAALERAGIDAMPHWKDALERYLKTRSSGQS